MAAMTENARVRVFAAEPALPATAASQVVVAVEKLLRQFEREGRCVHAAAWTEQEGRFILIAWEGPELSGCSHDKLAQVLQAAERIHGVDILGSPPIALERPPRLLTRGGLRAALAAEDLSPETCWWPLRAETLEAWRKGPATLRDSGLLPAAGRTAP